MSRRDAENHRRVDLLIQDFERYLLAFDAAPAFRRTGQLENHIAAISRRRELGTATASVRDTTFLRLLYETLNSWGIGQRGSRLLKFDDFVQAVCRCESSIASVEQYTLDNPALDEAIADTLWQLVDSLQIVENDAKLVASTKALHHILPELVVPMDRAFTRVFFGWHGPEFQYQQKKAFYAAHRQFARIAREANPAQFVGSGWRTSLTKNIDNALVGFCQTEEVPVPS